MQFTMTKYYIIPQNNHPSVYSRSFATMGFFAKFTNVLEQLLRMEVISKANNEEYIPFVDFESIPSSLRDYTNNETNNEWEYCFKQANKKDVLKSEYIQLFDGTFYAGNYPDNYPKPSLGINPGGKNFKDKELVKELNYLINKYLKVRDDVLERLNDDILKYKTLGVHCRRSEMHLLHGDIALNYENDTYLKKIMKVFDEGNFEKIYIATEEIEIINYLKNKIPDKILHQDCYRILRNESPFQASFLGLPRDKHFTLHAQEVLIDALNLSKCNSLICGISGVSNGAIYFNGLDFENVYYFDEIDI
jgi:hypothetical protein